MKSTIKFTRKMIMPNFEELKKRQEKIRNFRSSPILTMKVNLADRILEKPKPCLVGKCKPNF